MNRNYFSRIILVLSFISIAMLWGQTKPSSDEAKAFIDFYYNGQGAGVVLADMKICREVVENECSGEVAIDSRKKNEKYVLWMMYVVPKDDKIEGLIIQFNQGGLTRFTREASVSGSVRYRTWRSFKLNQTGVWEIKVLQDKGTEVETLKTISLTVAE